MRKRDLKYLEHACLGTGEFSALKPKGRRPEGCVH